MILSGLVKAQNFHKSLNVFLFNGTFHEHACVCRKSHVDVFIPMCDVDYYMQLRLKTMEPKKMERQKRVLSENKITKIIKALKLFSWVA